MLKILILACFLFTPVVVNAKNLEVDITISKGGDPSRWAIDYYFSEGVSAVNFENTPYSFVKSDWLSQTRGAVFDLSSLQVNFNTVSQDFTLKLRSENDRFIRGFYTPFLNFSDGSNALFIGHYLPAKVKVGAAWIDVTDMAVTLTIKAPKSDGVLYSGLNEVQNLELSVSNARQYAYIGNLASKAYEKFNVILDPKLPGWIQQAYLKAIPDFYNYYEVNTGGKLNFVPLFIVNFKAGNMRPRLDGGAINKQIAINIVGDGWAENPEANLNNIISLLAHEMAHLWNSQHWRLADNSKIWMHEGGANYFARNAMLNFGYISSKEYIKHFRSQADKCMKALNNSSIATLRNRSDAYVCGEVLYQLSASMIEVNSSLDVWNKIVGKHESLSYSEADFIQVLEDENINKVDVDSIKNILYGNSGEELDFLIEKYAAE